MSKRSIAATSETSSSKKQKQEDTKVSRPDAFTSLIARRNSEKGASSFDAKRYTIGRHYTPDPNHIPDVKCICTETISKEFTGKNGKYISTTYTLQVVDIKSSILSLMDGICYGHIKKKNENAINDGILYIPAYRKVEAEESKKGIITSLQHLLGDWIDLREGDVFRVSCNSGEPVECFEEVKVLGLYASMSSGGRGALKGEPSMTQAGSTQSDSTHSLTPNTCYFNCKKVSKGGWDIPLPEGYVHDEDSEEDVIMKKFFVLAHDYLDDLFLNPNARPQTRGEKASHDHFSIDSGVKTGLNDPSTKTLCRIHMNPHYRNDPDKKSAVSADKKDKADKTMPPDSDLVPMCNFTVDTLRTFSDDSTLADSTIEEKDLINEKCYYTVSNAVLFTCSNTFKISKSSFFVDFFNSNPIKVGLIHNVDNAKTLSNNEHVNRDMFKGDRHYDYSHFKREVFPTVGKYLSGSAKPAVTLSTRCNYAAFDMAEFLFEEGIPLCNQGAAFVATRPQTRRRWEKQLNVAIDELVVMCDADLRNNSYNRFNNRPNGRRLSNVFNLSECSDSDTIRGDECVYYLLVASKEKTNLYIRDMIRSIIGEEGGEPTPADYSKVICPLIEIHADSLDEKKKTTPSVTERIDALDEIRRDLYGVIAKSLYQVFALDSKKYQAILSNPSPGKITIKSSPKFTIDTDGDDNSDQFNNQAHGSPLKNDQSRRMSGISSLTSSSSDKHTATQGASQYPHDEDDDMDDITLQAEEYDDETHQLRTQEKVTPVPFKPPAKIPAKAQAKANIATSASASGSSNNSSGVKGSLLSKRYVPPKPVAEPEEDPIQDEDEDEYASIQQEDDTENHPEEERHESEDEEGEEEEKPVIKKTHPKASSATIATISTPKQNTKMDTKKEPVTPQSSTTKKTPSSRK